MIAVASVTAAACGDDDDGGGDVGAPATSGPSDDVSISEAPGSTLAASATTETTPPAEEDGDGAAFVVGLATPPPTLNRNLISDPATSNVALAVYDGLVGVGRDQQIIPELAESWEVSDDALTFTFHLKEGVTWHDGQPFSSADVVYTFEEVLPLSFSFGNLEGLIDHVEAPDESTVVVQLTQPFAPLLTNLIPSLLVILPKHLYEGTDLLTNEYNLKPIGTGAFKFESWEGDTIELVRNEDFWGDRPAYERIVFQVIPDSTTRANALKGGEIDFLSSNDVDQAVEDALRGEDSVRLERNRATYSMGYLSFNTRNPPLDDPEVRKALYMALDREQIAQATDAEGGAAATSSIASNSWASAPEEVNYSDIFPFDPDQAEQILDAAGYPRGPDGTRFNVLHRYFTSAAAGPPSGPIIADLWGRIGVEVELVADERAVGTEAVWERNEWDTFVRNHSARLDPQSGMVVQYACRPEPVVNQNPSGYCNPEFDAIAERASVETEQAARRELFIELDKIVARDLPTAVLIELNDADAIRADVGGLEEFFDAGEGSEFRWEALTPPADS